jgi:uncharacterized protein
MNNPFHEGEARMQSLTGESEEAEMNSPMIASRIAKGAIPFLTQRTLAVLATENEGVIWCSSMVGDAGFVSVPDQSRLAFDLRKLRTPIDPAILAAAEGKGPAGSIFIDLQTRRRYRINGTLSHPDSDTIELRVREAYGNCPKYITRRTIQWDTDRNGDAKHVSGERLSKEQTRTLQSADLFFMATGHPERGLDASHRGGNPGFVTVVDDKTIYFPDYPGNSLFNSLGNLLIDNRIGLLIPDLKRRRALRITGTATVDFQDSVHEVTTTDAPRRVEVSLSRWDELDFPIGSSHLIDYSPYNP